MSRYELNFTVSGTSADDIRRAAVERVAAHFNLGRDDASRVVAAFAFFDSGVLSVKTADGKTSREYVEASVRVEYDSWLG